MVRAGLRQFFADLADFNVVAEAANGREALDIVRKGEVDATLPDLGMRDQGGVDVLAGIKARAPDGPALTLSGFSTAHHAIAWLRQGASGFLNKDCNREEIVKAIRTVVHGRKYVTAGMAELLAERMGAGGDQALHEQLFERELQVFLRLAKGETVGRLAQRMSLSVKTVSTCRTRVMGKMQQVSNSAPTCCALKNGLIHWRWLGLACPLALTPEPLPVCVAAPPGLACLQGLPSAGTAHAGALGPAAALAISARPGPRIQTDLVAADSA